MKKLLLITFGVFLYSLSYSQTDLFVGYQGNGGSSSVDSLIIIDTTSGISISSKILLTSSNSSYSVDGLFGMSLHPFTNVMYVVYGTGSNSLARRLGTLNTTTGLITDIDSVGCITDITFGDGVLYATTGANHVDDFSFGSIDLVTGNYTKLFDHLNSDASNALVFDYFNGRFIKSTQFTAAWDLIDISTLTETNSHTTPHPGWTTGLVPIDASTIYSVGDDNMNTVNTSTWSYSSIFTEPEGDVFHSIAFGSYPVSLWVNGTRNGCLDEQSLLTVVGGGTTFQWFKDGSLIPGATTSTYEGDTTGSYYVIVNGKPTNSINLVINTINDGVTVVSPTIVSQETSGSYQWIDCGTNTDITGATGQSFTPSYTGNFAVILTKGGCIDTSACTPINFVGLNSQENQLEWEMYPNPANDKVQFTFSGEYERGSVKIYNAIGKLVYDTDLKTTQNTINIDLNNFANGMYNVTVVSGSNVMNKKLTINR